VRVIAAFCGLLVLAGCQTAAQNPRREALAATQGRPLADLIRVFGRAPVSSIAIATGRLYTFEGDQVTLFGGETQFGPGVARTMKCVLLAETDQHDILKDLTPSGPCGL
jgi:hypothetical protein